MQWAMAARSSCTASATMRSSALMRSTISSGDSWSMRMLRGLRCSVSRASRFFGLLMALPQGLNIDILNRRKFIRTTIFGQLPKAPMTDSLLAGAEALHDELVAVRRDLHRHPELAFHEERTSALMAQKSAELGYEVRRGV